MKSTNNVFSEGSMLKQKLTPKLMFTVLKLWMTGHQDLIFQYLLEPKAGSVGAIKNYQKRFLLGLVC
ncbi:MAG: hypothetical protein VXZ35_12940 [Pseudomonadota bacterium]|nr:hypothetical protein [Pseudomonadota bacterium]